MAERYSKFFNVEHKDLARLGVFDGHVDQDAKLHIDPLLLKNCIIPEFKNAYSDFLKYFNRFIHLVPRVKQTSKNDIFFRRIINSLTFSEIHNTGLGYSEKSNIGNGISGKIAENLAYSAYEIIKAGFEDPEIFCLMQLLEDKVGADRISDMTIYILQSTFLSYTERVCRELRIRTRTYSLNGRETFNVPYYDGNPILFIPISILSDLPIAYEYEDIDKVCNYNARLKARVAEIIGIQWHDYKDYSKRQWKDIIFGNRKCYETAMNYYKSIQGKPYDFTVDQKDYYLDIRLQDILAKYPVELKIEDDSDIRKNIYEITMAICQQLKHLVEDNRLSELFHRNGRNPDETDWQMLLYAIANTFKLAGNLNISVTREDNPGVGEIDFHITMGAEANVIIEIKRSSNKDLLHGYREQLPAYMRADKATDGIFMVIFDTDNFEKVKQSISNVQDDMKQKGEYIPEVIYINGMHQDSASNSKYKNSSL